jgi:ribonucleoside-diphosphate reductase beta chain
MSVFDTQKAFKPFMYNWAVKFKEAISDTPWTIKKFTFDSDYHEYQTLLTRPEREGARRGMLAISQVEVKVKDYWGDLGKRFPRPEFSQVGWTFAENEVRHADSYSALLDLLGLAQDFEWVMDTPAIGGRVDYLSKHLAVGTARHEHTLSLVLFSILVENVSLFAQFALLRSIRKHRNMLKGVSNVVDATMQEEQVHGLFGIRLVINESLGLIGGRPLFAVDPAALANTEWLSVELLARTSYDFFDSHVTNYSQAGKAITADSIF